MSSTSFADFQRDPDRYFDEVCGGRAPLRVTRENARSVVVVCEEEYDSMVETLHLLASPANARRLRASIAEADAGHLQERDPSDGA